jgi:hypothetical protein
MRFVGQPRGTLIATLLRPWFEPAIVHRFRRTDFVPAPHVEVVMLRLHNWNHTEAGLWPRRDRVDVDLNQEPDPAWLGNIAERVRSRLATFKRPSMIGHADWWSENVRWVGHRLHVVHDWDSVTAQPVGSHRRTFAPFGFIAGRAGSRRLRVIVIRPGLQPRRNQSNVPRR